MGVCCGHQLPSVLSRRAGWSRGRSHPWLIPIITWYWKIWLLTINILLTKCKSKFESRVIPVRVAMLPRNFEDKYHSRPHPLLMKCEARAISRDPVLMRAIELRLYARMVSSAWWRRRLDHAVLFKSFDFCYTPPFPTKLVNCTVLWYTHARTGRYIFPWVRLVDES